MFGFVIGIPISEYIRRRRLTVAALELQQSNAKVIDVALKFGYNSADSFTRAFQNLHGIPPSKAREKGVTLKAYPRITFTLTIEGVVAMNYRIEEKEGFTVVGIKEFISLANEENYLKIPQMWQNISKETTALICSQANREPSGLLGVCADMYDNGFDYWIGAATTNPCPESLSKLNIPASTWAIFEAIGPMPDALQKLWKRIYSEWLPSSGYEHAKSPEIEWYSDGDTSSPTYKSEIWIPVIKK